MPPRAGGASGTQTWSSAPAVVGGGASEEGGSDTAKGIAAVAAVDVGGAVPCADWPPGRGRRLAELLRPSAEDSPSEPLLEPSNIEPTR